MLQVVRIIFSLSAKVFLRPYRLYYTIGRRQLRHRYIDFLNGGIHVNYNKPHEKWQKTDACYNKVRNSKKF